MDTTLTIERIKYALDQRFEALIDLGDLPASMSVDDRRQHQLSRSVAALAIMTLSEADAEAAAASITDGHDDLGLDAIYFESAEDTLYVVQSKFSSSGTKTIDLGECQKFLAGLRDLIHADFSKANPRLKRREQEIRSILMRSDVRIVMAVAHTGASKLGDQVQDALDKFLQEQNNAGQAEVFSLEIFDLARVYAHLDPAARKKINLTLGLSEWGNVLSPYRAVYGQLKISDVANWAQHGRALLDRNLRFYRGNTEVNNAMDDTIVGAPEKFWYFNNGITVLCDKIAKAPLNGSDNRWGVFECEGVSVVNGAQTVGVVWERVRQSEELFKTSTACVHIRIISLENCPEGFAADVTRATNTQNEIKHRDFAALDEIQHQIAREMALDNRRYAFKSGDVDPQGGDGCTIEEATVALACASPDLTLAVAAKREIGSLWRDLTKPPYTTIFNANTKARDVWRAVVVYRAVEDALKDRELASLERGDQILVHGNRFILHTVFRESDMQIYRDASVPEDTVSMKAKQVTKRAFMEIAKAVNEQHPGAYLQPLFKNAQKCKELLSVSSGVSVSAARQMNFWEMRANDER
jgi:hypothetical protein